MATPTLPTHLRAGRASDLTDLFDRALYRFLEILPGLLSWGTLVGVTILSALRPVWVAIFIILFDAYWLLKTIFLSVHLVAAYRRMRKNLKVDWLRCLESLPPSIPALPRLASWRDLWHLVILPVYNESPELVRSSLEALRRARYPLDRLIVVLATEERSGAHGRLLAKEMSREFGAAFFRFLVTVHPANIAGEIAGKGSNETWAGRRAGELLDELQIPYEHIIVSVFDSDTRVFPDYFARLAHAYLTVPQPLRTSYQPVPMFANNIWDAPFFSRVVASSATFWHMMQQEMEERLSTFSSHAMSFAAIVEIGFWQTNIVSEDSRIFWQAFLSFDGNYRVYPLHYPVAMDACLAATLWQTAKNQYKQQRRWGWGVENVPYMLFGFLKNKKIPLGKKLYYTFIKIEGFWSWATNSLLIFALGWLPLILGGRAFNTSVLSYNLPLITRSLLTLAMVGLFVSAALSVMLLPPRPPRYRRWRTISMALQWLFLPISVMVLGAFPGLDAQTRLMLGKYMGFWVTDKVRK